MSLLYSQGSWPRGIGGVPEARRAGMGPVLSQGPGCWDRVGLHGRHVPFGGARTRQGLPALVPSPRAWVVLAGKILCCREGARPPEPTSNNPTLNFTADIANMFKVLISDPSSCGAWLSLAQAGMGSAAAGAVTCPEVTHLCRCAHTGVCAVYVGVCAHA